MPDGVRLAEGVLVGVPEEVGRAEGVPAGVLEGAAMIANTFPPFSAQTTVPSAASAGETIMLPDGG